MRLVGISLIVLTTLTGTAFAVAPTNSMPSAGLVQVWATPDPGNSPDGRIVVTGAIGDYGKTTNTEKNGKVNSNGDYVKMDLSKGSFAVDQTAIEPMYAHLQPKIDSQTCTATFKLTGVLVVLSQDTGLYAGISGKGTLNYVFAGIARRYASGAKKGQCNMSSNSEPIAGYNSVTGAISVRFA